MWKEIHNALGEIHAWAMSPVGFWVIWITVTVAAAVCAAWSIEQASARKIQWAKEVIAPAQQIETFRDIPAVILLAIFLAFYIAMTLLWEDFAYYDNSIFTRFTLIGRDYPPPIWPQSGRFFPLSLQEFNLIRHFVDTHTGYQLLPLAQVLIFSCIFLLVDDQLRLAARAGLVTLVLLTPSVWIIFNGLTFAERDVLFLLACLVLSIKRFEQTQSTAWAVVAIICAQAMLYSKETAFLLLLGFAAGRLILRSKNAQGEWDWDKEAYLDLCLASLAVVFLLYYWAGVGFHNMQYADERRQPRTEVLFAYLRVDLLVWLFVALMLARVSMILRGRAAPAALWDGLAFGGVFYLAAYPYLGIFATYYLAPVDLIAVLYVGRFAILSWPKVPSWGKVAGLMLAFAIILQDVSLSAMALFERKNIIRGKVETAGIIEAQYDSRAGSAIRLFFPFASPYVIMEFAAYLSYRGVPVEGAADKTAGLDSVILASSAVAEDGPCVEYSSIRCHALSGPDPGDLVIVLPDDEGSFAESSVYRERAELLFSYVPRPPIPQRLFSRIPRIASSSAWVPGYMNKKLPDRWMYAAVMIWK